MKDFAPEEASRIEAVREKFIQTARLFSFKMMEPSPIESLSTLEAKSGSAIKDEIYFFKDKGMRDVALRFDFTVGLTRYVASQQSLKLPAKLGSFGGVFRYDEPQRGRYRFFHQWNIEIFGRPSPESESEVIEFTSRLFGDLGLEGIEIQINHRRLVESYIRKNYPDFDPGRQEEIFADSFRLVDKAAKKPRESLLAEYRHVPQEFAQNLLDFATIAGTPEQVRARTDVSGLESWDYLEQLWILLQNRSVDNIAINFGIVRGLDYYSGTVFEVFDTSSKLGALAGGGRYDKLTRAFGRDDIGATGIAGGVERMILAMDEQGIRHAPKVQKIAVLYVNADMQRQAMNLASRIRAKNIPVEIDLVGRSLKKQMEAASDAGLAVIVGPKEASRGQIVLKNMADGTESAVSIDELLGDAGKYLCDA